jgi:hypothetical protein
MIMKYRILFGLHTFNDLPSRCLSEELTLSQYCLCTRPLADADFNHGSEDGFGNPNLVSLHHQSAKSLHTTHLSFEDVTASGIS